MIDYEEEVKGESRFKKCADICDEILKPGK